jgi:hypothetical protein
MTDELRQAYVKSRNSYRGRDQHNSTEYAKFMTEIRTAISNQHPDLDIHSKEFARLVAEAVREATQD